MKKRKPEKENLVHVKVDYSDAINSKKEFLSSELNLLQTASIIKRYTRLRLEELKIKNRLLSKIKELKTDSTRLQIVLPKIKIHTEKIAEEKKEDKEFDLPKRYIKDDLEFELQDIQRKLMELEERG
jgi:hypothetical protein